MADTFRKSGGGMHRVSHDDKMHSWNGGLPPPPEGAEPASPLMMATVTMTVLLFGAILLAVSFHF